MRGFVVVLELEVLAKRKPLMMVKSMRLFAKDKLREKERERWKK